MAFVYYYPHKVGGIGCEFAHRFYPYHLTYTTQGCADRRGDWYEFPFRGVFRRSFIGDMSGRLFGGLGVEYFA